MDDQIFTDSSLRLLGDRKPWPKNVRGFPKQLLVSGTFLAISSKDKYGQSERNLEFKANKAKGDKSPKVQYELIKNSLSIRHFRVLLELIDMSKGMNVGDSKSFAPGKLLERLGLKRCGSSYKDLARMIHEIAELQFLREGDITGESEHTLFSEFITTNKTTLDGLTKDNETTDPRIWNFKFSGFMCALLANDDITTVHTSIMGECGRSPLLQWLYLFYSTHGSNGKNTFDYKLKTLAQLSGLMQRLSLSKTKDLAMQAIKAANREIAHRVKQSLSKLHSMKVFKSINVVRAAVNPDTYAIEYKTEVQRFDYESETNLAETTLIDRPRLFEAYITAL